MLESLIVLIVVLAAVVVLVLRAVRRGRALRRVARAEEELSCEDLAGRTEGGCAGGCEGCGLASSAAGRPSDSGDRPPGARTG